MKIWTLGDAVVDLMPEGKMQYTACAGGAPVNVAVGAAQLECDCGFIGRVGDDPFGHFLQNTLAQKDVDTQHMQFDAVHQTSTVVVSLGDNSDRSFTFWLIHRQISFCHPRTCRISATTFCIFVRLRWWLWIVAKLWYGQWVILNSAEGF